MDIDYDRLIAEANTYDVEALVGVLTEELPHDWTDAYKLVSRHRPNIYRFTVGTFEYLFNFVDEVPQDVTVENRVVAVHGRSHAVKDRRRDHLMRNRPMPMAFSIAGIGPSTALHLHLDALDLTILKSIADMITDTNRR
ncbi:MAG TPA: hypothetical protein VGN12_25505 [Pirellulales bacterium]|jgi:hypothetical protein